MLVNVFVPACWCLRVSKCECVRVNVLVCACKCECVGVC